MPDVHWTLPAGANGLISPDTWGVGVVEGALIKQLIHSKSMSITTE